MACNWCWGKSSIIWTNIKTVIQITAALALCGAVVWVLNDASQRQDSIQRSNIVPALCAHNVNLTEFAMSMKWDKYHKPEYVWFKEDLDLQLDIRKSTPVPVVCSDRRRFCNDTLWLPWPSYLGTQWLQSGERLPPVYGEEPAPRNMGPDLAAAIECYPTSLDIQVFGYANMQCSAYPYGKKFVHKNAAEALLALPKDQNLTILWPGNQQTTYQDGEALKDVQFSMGLYPSITRSQQGSSSQQYFEQVQGPSNYPGVSMEFSIYFSVSLTSSSVNASMNGTKSEGPAGKPVPFMVWVDLRSGPMYTVSQQGCEWIDETTVQVFGVVTIAPLPASLLLASGVLMWALTALTVLVAFGVLGSCTGVYRYFNNGTQANADPPVAAAAGNSTSAQPGRDEMSMIMAHGDILAFGSALLFALPTMRGLWPAAPSGGTLFDSLTIYPQLMLIAFALMLLLLKKYLVIREQRAKLARLIASVTCAVTVAGAGTDAVQAAPGSEAPGQSANTSTGSNVHVAAADATAGDSAVSQTAGNGGSTGAATNGGHVELVVPPMVPPSRAGSLTDGAA
jgi:hypothetical protein